MSEELRLGLNSHLCFAKCLFIGSVNAGRDLQALALHHARTPLAGLMHKGSSLNTRRGICYFWQQNIQDYTVSEPCFIPGR